MTTRRLCLYVFGLAAMMLTLVAIERFTEAGLRLLVPSPLTKTLGTSEYSIVEGLQVFALVVIALLAWHCARLSRPHRSLSVIWTAIACAAVCRELDLFLDGYLFDHAWQLLVAGIAVIAIVHAVRHRRALGLAWARAIAEPATVLIVMGMALTTVFANVIGSEGLWVSLMGDQYARIAKIAAEEFAELAGYWVWLVGQIEFTLNCRRQYVMGEQRQERRRKERRPKR